MNRLSRATCAHVTILLGHPSWMNRRHVDSPKCPQGQGWWFNVLFLILFFFSFCFVLFLIFAFCYYLFLVWAMPPSLVHPSNLLNHFGHFTKSLSETLWQQLYICIFFVSLPYKVFSPLEADVTNENWFLMQFFRFSDQWKLYCCWLQGFLSGFAQSCRVEKVDF